MDEYFDKQTKHILDLMVDALAADPTRTFIWAETSYFAMWWDVADESRKATTKRLIARKQLEIVAGGWVMPDEANSYPPDANLCIASLPCGRWVGDA